MVDQHTEYLDDDQIVEHFISRMSEADKRSWTEIDSTDLIECHHTTGRGIRNYYLLWDENNPHRGTKHPDDRSMEIICKVWKKLNPDKQFTGYYKGN